MLYIAICDDKQFFIDKEKKIISEYLSCKHQEFLIDTYISGEQLLQNLTQHDKYDVVFLDVRMQDVDGLETAKRLRLLTKGVYIIFVSALLKFSVDGYKVGAFRYIVKNNDTIRGELVACLEDLLEQITTEQPEIALNIKNKTISIAYSDIIYIESYLHNVTFHLSNNKVRRIYGKLDDIEIQLNDDRFCRTHQSYLLNLDYADKICGDKIILIDKKSEIYITRTKLKKVREQYLIYRGHL